MSDKRDGLCKGLIDSGSVLGIKPLISLATSFIVYSETNPCIG